MSTPEESKPSRSKHSANRNVVMGDEKRGTWLGHILLFCFVIVLAAFGVNRKKAADLPGYLQIDGLTRHAAYSENAAN